MRRIFASARVAILLAAGATSVLIAFNVAAVAQLLDPGWQILYAPQSNYGGGGGLIDSMFGDGAGMPAVPRVYQPAPPVPMYYQPMPAPQPRVYQRAPVYYEQVPAPLTRAYQGAPMYYQQVPAPQAGMGAPSPAYYQRLPARQARADQATPQYTAATPPVPPQQVAAAPASQPAAKHLGLFMQAPGPQQSAAQTPSQSRELAPQQAAQPMPQPAPAPPPHSFFQLGWSTPQPSPAVQSEPQPQLPPRQSFFQLTPLPQPAVAYNEPAPAYAPSEYGDMAHPMVDPKYDRQVVDYKSDEASGTIIVDTRHYFLYLVMEGGKAMRYGIGVGHEGFTWAGVNQISAMREWPDWRPPNDMLERRPDLPRYMAGGLDNPLGARALYLGSTLYRIHGSNEPWTIGTQVSSGCIRLRNADIIDLYGRVTVGTKVVVI